MSVDSMARVSPDSDIASDVDIGPYAVIEAGVRLSGGCRIGAHAVVKKGTRVGARVRVLESAVLGGDPQDLKFADAESFVEIGEDSIIREFATVHRSSIPGGTTRLGRGCYLMAYGHVAHDCEIGERAIIANFTALAGHVTIGPGAFLSGGVVVHQFCRIGELAMVGGGSKITVDVPPFLTADGVPARVVGLNLVGLRRAGVTGEGVPGLKKAYRILYRSRLPREEALRRIEDIGSPETHLLASFIRESERGICRERRGTR